MIVSTLNCNSNVSFTTSSHRDCDTSILGRCYNLPSEYPLESYDAVFVGPVGKTLRVLSMSLPVKSWHYFNGFSFSEYSTLHSRWLRKRNYAIEKIRDAQAFGIIVASLNIQYYLQITEFLKQILRKVNKKVYLFSMEELSPTKLANFPEVCIHYPLLDFYSE